MTLIPIVVGYSRIPPPSALSSYTGPGDVVASATAWWGLRGYSNAYAAPGTNPAMDVVKTSDGSSQTTINILNDGSLDVATIAALGFAVSVKKLYDQSGNGRDLNQATLANMPTITLSGLGALPILVFDGTASTMTVTSVAAAAQPFTFSFVVKSTNKRAGILDQGVTGVDSLHSGVTANKLAMLASTGTTYTVSDNVVHAVQNIFNGASSTGYVDGVSNSISIGTAALDTSSCTVGSEGGANFLNGILQELGIWTGAFSGGNLSSMDSNQRTYWGF